MTYLAAQVLPGPGTVYRRAHIGVWLGADVHEALAVQILEMARAAGDDDGASVVDEVSAVLSSEPPSGVGSLAVIAVVGPSVRAVLHGRVVVQNGRGEAHSGAFTSQVLQFDLPMDGLVSIWGSSGWDEAPAALSQDLRDGTVPGSGLVLRAEPAAEAPPIVATDDQAEEPFPVPPPPPVSIPIEEAPQPAEQPAAVASPTALPAAPPGEPAEARPDAIPPSGTPVKLLDLATAPPPRAPLPVAGEAPAEAVIEKDPAATGHTVKGVMCVNGHFNHPDSFYCRVCGISMIQLTKLLVDGPRPALGVIVVADGSTYTLEEDYVIGREPDSSDGRAIVLNDERISRQHARLSASGWDVVVTDLNSSNGTYVKNPGWQDWVKAAPGHPVVVEPRGQIGMGSQILVYETSVRPSKV